MFNRNYDYIAPSEYLAAMDGPELLYFTYVRMINN